MQIIYRRVQNYAKSRQGQRPEAIIVHMADDDAESCLEKYNNPLLRNSAHYLITRSGEIWRLVEETDTAWHAGGVQKPTWKLLKSGINPNLYTIGIAHEGKTGEVWTDEMYQASAQLLANIGGRWDIKLDREHIIGHSEVNSTHNDPGMAVDFKRLIQQANNVYADDQNMSISEDQKTEATMLNRLSTLQLSLVALQNENKKLRTELTEMDPDKLTELQNQSIAMSEELYDCQQERNKLQTKFDKLQTLYNELKSEHSGYLAQFPTGELISAIIKRIRPRK